MKQIKEHIGYLLVQVCRAQRQCVQLALTEHGVHAGQEMILLLLYQEEGITQSQIAEQLGVEPPTVTKMLQRMEVSGLVARRQDAEDARVSRVYLTELGRRQEGPVLESWRGLEERFVAGLSDIEKTLLKRLLMQVLKNITG